MRSRRCSAVVMLLLAGACTDKTARVPASEQAPPPAAPPAPSTVGTPVASASASVAPPPAPWPANAPPEVATDWCTEDVSALEAGACYVLPEAPTRTLLVYLHGIVPPTKDSPQKTNFEKVVASGARRGGVAALIPRGQQGLAPKKFDRWWGWPTTGPSYRRLGEGFIRQFRDQQKRLEELAGVRFERVYVAGSSAGAYFAAAIALHGGMPEADGFGAISGGAGWKTTELDALPPKPFYVGYGKHDSVGGSARALADLLKRAGWPVRVAEHPLGHGAREIYIDEALAFWKEHAAIK